ncbi:glycine cleavage system protein GcvH [Halothiobacillus sp. DCM-1]|uniref:glycine cleavage system protein GcvH n=1 Tax=Halothiobacillus sp. DCM-1 TaxID=3112558 RepID=UPI003253CCE2
MSDAIPNDRRFGPTHEWVMNQGKTLRLGVTAAGQAMLGDVVFVQLPEVGAAVNQGAACATLESVKAASDVLSPVDGMVASVNSALVDSPELINDAPWDDGWILEITPTGPLAEWQDAEQYQHTLDQGA